MAHPLNEIVPDFNLKSYYSGIIMAFSEVVSAGCKQLALSSTYNHELANEMMKVAEYASTEYSVKLMLEPELLVSKLFQSDIAKDQTVILIAHDQSVIDEYKMLKKLKQYSDEEGNPDDLEKEIAQRFGALLSYDEATIERLIAKND